MNQLDGEVVVDLAAQAANGDFDDVRIAVEVHVPYVRRDLRTAEHLAVPAREQLQQRELARREIDARRAALDAAAVHVHFQVADADQFAFAWRPATRERAYACEQFDERKRFDEVVVGAEFETAHAVVDVVAGGEKEHGGGARGAQRFHDGPAVHPREHYVEDDDVVVLLLRENQAVGAVVRYLD